MKWTKEIHITGFRFVNKKFVEVRETVYKSDQGHVIVKDPHNEYWFENHLFSRLKDAKNYVEGKTDPALKIADGKWERVK